jgi:2-C-methyl-D-erythritol 4-phosphate cytidylyltransferase/2-C-methyl-D-erythritol 2,4-cyclodiphosphate synthase
VLHALTDAILGAVAAGDIGSHFPDSDPALRGADSALFLQRAVELALDRGYAIGNVDVTVLAERPRLAAHRDAMAHRIASILSISNEQVSLKAKTAEGLDAIGRGEAIAASCIVGLTATENEKQKTQNDRPAERSHGRDG